MVANTANSISRQVAALKKRQPLLQVLMSKLDIHLEIIEAISLFLNLLKT